jgi:hypothetical protein
VIGFHVAQWMPVEIVWNNMGSIIVLVDTERRRIRDLMLLNDTKQKRRNFLNVLAYLIDLKCHLLESNKTSFS